MWTSVLVNGRKNKRDESVDKIKQYLRLTDKSSFSNRMAKSTVTNSRKEDQNSSINRDKQNVPMNQISQVKNNFKVKPFGNGFSTINLGMGNLANKDEKNNKNLELAKKSMIKINYEKTTTVTRIKKQMEGTQGYQSFNTGNFHQTGTNNHNNKHSYFLQCLSRKNKIKMQMHSNIHNSILTFREFMRSCKIAKGKAIDTRLKAQTLGRKTIIFDMDQTLIHTNQSPTANYQIKVPFRSFQGKIGYGFVQVRPHAKQILVNLSKHFDVMIFTASTQAYADPIIDHIDPNKVIQHRLYRESCSFIRNQIFVKDLRVLGRDLANIVLVDNAPYSYMMQLGNAIPILPYYKGKDDDQLISLENYLMNLKDVDDVRTVNGQHFRLHEYMKYDSHERLIQNLYGQWHGK